MDARTDRPAAASGGSRLGSIATPAAVLALIALVAAVYAPVRRFDFVQLDDEVYVVNNDPVRAGWTRESLRWAFSSNVAGLWHPLTLISHLLDVTLFGLNPGAHHVVNALLHAANALLLFLLLRAWTRTLFPAALVAALFAVHPLNVDSVAWIAERKNVLSTLFWLLSLWGYSAFVRRPSGARYAAVAVPFVLALMTKPMAVTLPLTLLLLDFWPLRRFERVGPGNRARHLLAEKIPLLALSLVFSAATLAAHRGVGALVSGSALPWSFRLWLPADNGMHYLAKLVWPSNLAVIYPVPLAGPPLHRLLFALLLPAVLTALAWVGRRRHPCLLFGWAWYLVTLLPVSGVVPFGIAVRADRFVYVPAIGLFVALAWGLWEWGRGRRGRGLLAVGAAIGLVLVLAVRAGQQVLVWRDSHTLYAHALRVTQGNYLALNNLGFVLAREGRAQEALPLLREAVRLNPLYASAHNNLGTACRELKRFDEARTHLETALRLEPRNASALFNLALLARVPGDRDGAIRLLGRGLDMGGDNLEARLRLGELLAEAGRYAEAEACFRAAAQAFPRSPGALVNWGMALALQHRDEEAADRFRAALRLTPDSPPALNNLAWILATARDGRLRNPGEAVSLAERACSLSGRRDSNVLGTLAEAYASAGRYGEAAAAKREQIALAGTSVDAARRADWDADLARFEQAVPAGSRP
jgi:Flp pilus assembly protein TadD